LQRIRDTRLAARDFYQKSDVVVAKKSPDIDNWQEKIFHLSHSKIAFLMGVCEKKCHPTLIFIDKLKYTPVYGGTFLFQLSFFADRLPMPSPPRHSPNRCLLGEHN
jgi:hypothetical protein